MEQDALAVSTGLQKPYIYPEVHRIYRFYRFYNITDLQIFGRPESYNFSPGAHPRTHAGYNTKRCGEAGVLHQLVPAHARAREGRGGDTVVWRGGAATLWCGGAARPVRFVAATQACGVAGAGPSQLRGSSGVPPVGWGAAGLQSCWEAGPRARAHAEVN